VTAAPSRPFGFSPFPTTVLLAATVASLSLLAPILAPLVAALGGLSVAAWMAERRSEDALGRGHLHLATLGALAGTAVSLAWIVARLPPGAPPVPSLALAASLVGLWLSGRWRAWAPVRRFM